jgi:hypothetical protein
VTSEVIEGLARDSGVRHFVTPSQSPRHGIAASPAVSHDLRRAVRADARSVHPVLTLPEG